MEKSIMWQYIAQEQDVLVQQMQSKQTDEYSRTKSGMLQAIYFVAHGSSFNAAVCMAGFFARHARIRAYPYTPGSFCAEGCGVLAQEEATGAVVSVISQTGTSAGTLQALEKARAMGYRTLAVTGAAASPVAKMADDVLYLLCGEENSNAKTKGYSATLLLLLQLAISLGKENGALGVTEQIACQSELEGMLAALPEMCAQATEFCRLSLFGHNLHNLYVLGSGMNIGTAQEAQLKLIETMCMPAMFNDIGEFSHGMHRSIKSDSCVLLLRIQDCMSEPMKQTYLYLRDIGAQVWMLDASGEKAIDENCLCIPAFTYMQSLLLMTLVVQVLSVYAPEYNKQDPNRDAHNNYTLIAGTRVVLS